MCIYDIKRSARGKLCFVEPQSLNLSGQSNELADQMNDDEAVKANIQLPYVGSYGQYENCLVFPNPADPLFCP